MASTPLSGQQNRGSYDPWLDYNEDGIIDVGELRSLGEAYGSSGDVLRNVTIARHTTQYLRAGGTSITIPSQGTWLSDIVTIDGYAKVTVLVWLSSRSSCFVSIHAFGSDDFSWLVETVDPSSESWVKTYDVMNQRMQIEVENLGPSAVTGDVAVYLRA